MPRPRDEKVNEMPMTTLECLRYRLRISQAELAEVASVAQSTISAYENGLPMSGKHAKALYSALRLLGEASSDAIVAERVPILDSINPRDLPESWESVKATLSARNDNGSTRTEVGSLVA